MKGTCDGGEGEEGLSRKRAKPSEANLSPAPPLRLAAA